MNPNYTSLETSKRLATAGYVGETDMYWVSYNNVDSKLEWVLSDNRQLALDVIPAYSIATITETLPDRITKDGKLYLFDIWKLNDDMVIEYQDNLNEERMLCGFSSKRLVDCCGEMLAHLHEEGLLKAKE